MRDTFVPVPLVWEPLPAELLPVGDRLLVELEAWKGTPHRPGQRCVGVGVDCVRFVVAVMESMTGVVSQDIKVPQDACMHSKSTALGALRFFLESWPDHEDVLAGGKAQPGDVLVVGPRLGGPGHALIVGPRRNTLWHASLIGVHCTGWAFERPMTKVFRVFRGTNRECWG